MRNKRNIKRRFRQLKFDLGNILKNQGLKVVVLYVIVKVISTIPLLSSIFRKISNNRILVKVRVLDSWMYLDLLDPGISYQLLVHGVRERAHVEQVRSGLKPEMKGIDIGANIGYYVLLESRLVGPKGKIYCIEPAPANFSLLQKNITANNVGDRTQCFQYLVGDKNGPEKLFLSSAANSHSVSAVSGQSVDLPMVTLDHFVTSEGIDPTEIDFLRMDIEGYEVMVLQHIAKLTTGRKKPLKLFIELHPSSFKEWGWSLEKLLDHLEGLGFVIKSVVREREIDEQGKKFDRVIGVSNGKQVAADFWKWRKERGQKGLWAFFELPVNS